MKLNKKEVLEQEKPLIYILEIIKKIRVDSWGSEGHNGDKYVEYKIKNGLFTYHVNKEQRPFPLKDQRYCSAKDWGPEGQLAYYDAIDIALAVIKKGVEIEAIDADGNTALMLACWIGEPRLIKPILANGAATQATNNQGELALHLVARSGRLDALKLYLKKENVPNVSAVDKAGWTALHHLVDAEDIVDIFKLLQKNKIDNKLASITAKNDFAAGTTALDIAKSKSRTEVLPLLDTEKTSFTIPEIRNAATKGLLSVVEKYLKNGENVEMTNHAYTSTILLDVSRNDEASDNAAEMVKLLLAHGANIHAAESKNFNALLLCINSLYNKGPRVLAFDNEYMEHVKIAKVLIENGVNLLQVKVGSLQKPLRDAAEISPEITKMILDKLAPLASLKEELDYQDADGFTAMHVAARSGKVETLKLLVEAGADLNIAEGYGFIPIHEAIIAGHYEATKYLIEKGADIKHKISQADGAYQAGFDAKAIASKSRNKEIVKLFS